MSALPTGPLAARRPLAARFVGVAVLALVVAVGLSWAKWLPSWDRALLLQEAPAWPSAPLLESAGAVPSLAGAWQFTVGYVEAVWRAVVVALLAAAAVEALLPRAWLTRWTDRRSAVGQALAGGAASLPTMMCSCCAAPVAVSLRRNGAPTGAALAYWVGNPLLNPAVLVFIALLLPWEFVATRVVVGVALVVGASALIGRLLGDRSGTVVAPPAEAARVRELPGRYVGSLARFVVVLVPEYLALVFLMGLLTPWLSGLDGAVAGLGLASALIAAVAGTLLVVPTGGEIPVVAALLAVGAGAGTAGALLITLPALSVPSAAMVGRALGWRATTAMAVAVAGGGVVAAALLALLL